MRWYGYVGLCAAVVFAAGFGGQAFAQELEDLGVPVMSEAEKAAEEERMLRALGVVVMSEAELATEAERIAEAEKKNKEGRYQIEVISNGVLVWVLDTKTGLLRVCQLSRASNDETPKAKCGPSTYAGG